MHLYRRMSRRLVQLYSGPAGRTWRVLSVVAAAVVVAASAGLLVTASASGTVQKPATLAPVRRVAVPTGWKLTFSPTFSGTALNRKIWATCYWFSPKGCTHAPHLENEWYVPSQVTVSGGVLRLTAQHKAIKGTDSNGKAKMYSCRSGMITTNPGFNFEYGLVQIVARIPYNTGLWPALWLAASNHSWPPEIDIMEHWNTDPHVKVYVHPVGFDPFGGPVATPGDLSKGWHSFRLLWTKTSITWYIDGIKVYATKFHVPHQKMYILANLANTVTPVGPCTGTMQIKSVKVWQP